MAYKPSIDDISEVEQKSGYKPSLSDISDPNKASDMSVILRGLLSGAAEPGRGLANLMASGLQKIPGAGKLVHQIPEQQTQMLSPAEQQSALGKGSEVVGQVAPALASGGLSGLAEEALPAAAQAATRGLAAPAASMAAYSAATSPDDRGSQAALGALGGAGGELLARGVGAIPGSLGRIVGGTRAPEEVKAAQAVVPKGVKMPLGDVADSPWLQNAYKITQGVFGSGANKPYEQLRSALGDSLSKADLPSPDKVGNVNQSVMDDMTRKYEALKDNTRAQYDALGRAADSMNVPLDKDGLNDSIKKALDSVSGKLATKSGKRQLSDAVSDLKSYQGDIKDFGTATDQISNLNQDLTDSRNAGNYQAYRLYTLAKNGLEKTIEDSAKNNPELYQQYLNAKNARITQGKMEMLDKKTESPFYKAYQKGATPGNLVDQYVKPSKGTQDFTNLTQQLSDHIDPETGKAILSKKISAPSVGKQLDNLSKFTPEQIHELAGSESAPHLNNLTEFNKYFPGAVNKAFEPKTGFLGEKVAQALQLAGGGFGAAHGVGTGGVSIAAPMLGARAIQSGMRSPSLRNAYIKSLEKGAKKPTSDLMRHLSAALMAQGLTQGGQ